MTSLACLFATALLMSGAVVERPNVIVILADDLGWTDLGCCGSDYFRTPHLDALAARGVRFTDAYSACTVCSPTRAALLTGKYPARLHITDYIPGMKPPKGALLQLPNWTKHLPLEEITLAERLKPLGYRTASVGKWHLGDDPGHWPTAQGFDVNVAGSGAGQPPSYFDPYVRHTPVHGHLNMPTLKPRKAGEYLTDRLTDEAISLIENWKDQPFFLYLPHHVVHTPLQAREDHVEDHRRRLRPGLRHNNPVYAAMIQSMDDSLGRIVAKLNQLGLAERTAILFTSDNGGLVWKANATTNAPLRNGKGTEYEGGTRVPLIAYWPGTTTPGVCRAPVMSIDFVPTIVELVSQAGPAGQVDPAQPRNWDGVSFAAQLKDPKAKLDRDALYWHYPHYHSAGGRPYGAIRKGDMKLIEHYENGAIELYDLANDVGETTDVGAARPELARQLSEQLAAWRRDVGAQMCTPAH